MLIVSIVGARPQFIKCAQVSPLLRGRYDEIIIHTGQHYDDNMSRIFFQELEIPEPDYNLGIGSGTHGQQTGAMLRAIERTLLETRPDMVLVYGDTNSTLAGALAAVKLNIPVAHVEAGLRSYNKSMPEEINRIATDAVSSLLFAPSKTAEKILYKEGHSKGVYFTGDVMYDSYLKYSQMAKQKSRILEKLNLKPESYVLTTIHRPQNTDDFSNLRNLIQALESIEDTVVFPIHPRTQKQIRELGIDISNDNLRIIDPVSYFDMILLELNAKLIITDSGGVQKEAYFAKVPGIILRTETEWVELIQGGWSVLTASDPERICSAIANPPVPHEPEARYFGDGNAGKIIVKIITDFLTG